MMMMMMMMIISMQYRLVAKLAVSMTSRFCFDAVKSSKTHFQITSFVTRK